jgi:hypothetical protein
MVQNHFCQLAWRLALLLVSLASMLPAHVRAQSTRQLLPTKINLRSLESREWNEFPEHVPHSKLQLQFLEAAGGEATLQIWHRDVKDSWNVRINDVQLGTLTRDENAQVSTFAVAAEHIRDGKNQITVEPAKHKASDDIQLGEVTWLATAADTLQREATLQVDVTDSAGVATPCRITITRLDGTLAPHALESTTELATRTGVVYTLSGSAQIPLQAGSYRIYASRGMEWSIAEQEVTAISGETTRAALEITRVVSTKGWVACDTHVHTLTYSGHGDSSIQERMATLAGEGIEFPIATDHNVHINYLPFRKTAGAERWFTPVIGNEVTTKLGHFNVFPVRIASTPPDHQAKDWEGIFQSIYDSPDLRVAILNHARDLHGNFRPFGPENHIAIAGENYEHWTLRANGMEVINSGATQTDPYQLFHDWLGLLNRGMAITPVGCSDSHDVSRHFVGQGRTYIRVDDSDTGNIPIPAAVSSFVAGRVTVSYGLFATLEVDGKFGSGELAKSPDASIDVVVEVAGPEWVSAERVRLFANGQLIKTEMIPESAANLAGVKWTARWKLAKPAHDIHLVAIADGPGVTAPYWPMAKAYQPTSTAWKPTARAITGAVWIDADNNGQADSAFSYASKLVSETKADLPNLIRQLGDYDAATQIQAASVLRAAGVSPLSPQLDMALEAGTPDLRRAFAEYLDAWRRTEQARIKSSN